MEQPHKFGQVSVVHHQFLMKSIISSFTGASRNRNSSSEAKNDYKDGNSSSGNTGKSSNLRGMDEKLFNTCVDLLEVFTKKASSEPSFASDLVAVSHTSHEVESVVSSILGGMASKRFLESNSSTTLWVSLLTVLDSIPALFSAEHCGELRDGSEHNLLLLGRKHPPNNHHNTIEQPLQVTAGIATTHHPLLALPPPLIRLPLHFNLVFIPIT